MSDQLYDFDLYAISSFAKGYQLAWYINQALHVHMERKSDIEMHFVDGRKLNISNFLYETEASSIRLVKNKTSIEEEGRVDFLLPELKRFDFLVLVRGFDDTHTAISIKELLGAMKPVQFLQQFDPVKLKTKENLIF
jgi:hypothetical protein